MGFERVTAMIQGTKNFTDFSGIDLELRDRCLPSDLRRDRKAERQEIRHRTLARKPGSTGDDRAGKDRHRLPRHRRSHPHIELRDRRRHSAGQRRPRLCLASNPAPRRALRSHTRIPRTVFLQARRCPRRRRWAMSSRNCDEAKRRSRKRCAARRKAFNKTLDKGIELVRAARVSRELPICAEQDSDVKFSGDGHSRFAFKLYDEQGFPFDLTELMARERGLDRRCRWFREVDGRAARSRARRRRRKTAIELSEIGSEHRTTNFLGYDHDHTGADVSSVYAGEGEDRLSFSNNSVCYAEMGGQVGDTGDIAAQGRSPSWQITTREKPAAHVLHLIEADDAPGRSWRARHVTKSTRLAAARSSGITP